jgi:hypothetical protein
MPKKTQNPSSCLELIDGNVATKISSVYITYPPPHNITKPKNKNNM